MCYTYDDLSRVTARTVKSLADDTVISTETFTYDAAGNITDAPDSCFAYDTNNKLTVFCGNEVSYDLDGNMLSNGSLTCTYDSANRLVSAGGHTYTYNAEGVRIRNLCYDADTTYTYDTNCSLSKLLCKTTNDITTKYVYGRGLIGEEKLDEFKTYHFDSRGSTIAMTNINGAITDTFAYDTYGKCISHTGDSFVIFGYNGRDGVITDKNGLIYMRARYYSPNMKRFINADIIPGKLSEAITLNRFAYANGNPVSFVDPFGLWSLENAWNSLTNWVSDTATNVKNWAVDSYNTAKDAVVDTYNTTKQAVVDTYNDVKEWAVDTYNDAKETLVDVYDDVKTWSVNTAKEATNIAKQAINSGINAVKTVQKIRKDLANIVLSNIEFGAGISIGMGLTYDTDYFGIEAISRMDIAGIQFKDGKLRTGHFGRSALTLGVGSLTLGPQSDTYEDFGLNTREVSDPYYYDVGVSGGQAAAFVIGYHYEYSISFSEMKDDFINYVKSYLN